MGAFQILFFVLTLAVPGYFLTRTDKVGPSAEWGAWAKSMARLIDSDGGFPDCSTLETVDMLEDLCHASRNKADSTSSVALERSSAEVTFSCEYQAQSIRVGWRLQESKTGDLKCRDPGGAIIPKSPAFIFAHNGRIRSLEFTGEDGVRTRIPARNCRVKALALKEMKPPETLDDLFVKIGRMKGDPNDYINANFMCFVFDFSPLWQPWRERYRR